jgi:hypothetical protein
MSDESDLLWIVPAFVVGWVIVMGLISVLGGWWSLARRFPLPDHQARELEHFGWRGLSLNYITSYRSCVNITLTELGVILKTSLLFSAFHKPIFFRWTDISNPKYIKGLFGTRRLVFYLGRTRLAVVGKPAERINSELSNSSLQPTQNPRGQFRHSAKNLASCRQ